MFEPARMVPCSFSSVMRVIGAWKVRGSGERGTSRNLLPTQVENSLNSWFIPVEMEFLRDFMEFAGKNQFVELKLVKFSH